MNFSKEKYATKESIWETRGENVTFRLKQSDLCFADHQFFPPVFL